MVTLKLTLKSKKPSNVYAINGKAYRLQPGSNTLHLEYDDYVSLAKALGIKPVHSKDTESNAKNDEKSNNNVKEAPKKEAPEKEKALEKKDDSVKEPEVQSMTDEELPEEPAPDTESPAEEPVEEPHYDTTENSNESHDDESLCEPAADEVPVEEHNDGSVEEYSGASVEEPVSENEEKESDYASMSYTELKAKYKEITGTTCKLKKAEVIQFLQEHDSNV